jgi:hypothetical protein
MKKYTRLVCVVVVAGLSSGCSVAVALGNCCLACGGSLANGGGPANGAISSEVALPQLAAEPVKY